MLYIYYFIYNIIYVYIAYNSITCLPGGWKAGIGHQISKNYSYK